MILETDARANGVGSGKIEARTAIGETEPAFSSNLQGVAIVTGMAGTAITQAGTAVSAVLNNDPNIKNAFGVSPEFWALGELGDKISSLKPGDTQETATSSFDVFVDLSKSAKHDLLVGLYGPVVTDASKINEIVLDVTLGAGPSLEHADFITDISGTAAAKPRRSSPIIRSTLDRSMHRRSTRARQSINLRPCLSRRASKLRIDPAIRKRSSAVLICLS
jgi:hypothetical protein